MTAGVVVPHEARDLSTEEMEDRRREASILYNRIVEDLAQGRAAAWDLADAMYEFHQQSGWSALGFESQDEWLAQPEISMTKTQYFRLVRRWRELVIQRQLPVSTLVRLEPSKLDIVMPAIEVTNDKTKLGQILNDVESMGARDLREEYMGIKPAPPEENASKDPDEDDVIEGTATVIDDEPVPASEVGADSETESEEDKERKAHMKALGHSAGVVDSWLDMGGDRRKAQRHLGKLVAEHPFFVAMEGLNAFVNGAEDAPDKADAKAFWSIVTSTLDIELEA